MSIINGHHRESIAKLQQPHAEQLVTRVRAQFVERNHALEAALELHVDDEPAWRRRVAAAVEMLVAPVKGRRVGVRGAHHANDADDAGQRAAGVIHEGLLAAPHLVPQEVARLVVAHAVPGRGALRERGQMVDAESRGLGLEQPMAHESMPRSEQLQTILSYHAIHWHVMGLRLSADRKSTRLNSSHTVISYAVFCLKKKK